MSLREETIEMMKKRRQRLLDGGINSIPSPFRRFSNDFLGWEQGTYYLFTSYTKAGKSQLVSFLIFEALLYCYKHENDVGISMKVIYFPLEETQQRIMTRIYSWLLMKLYGKRISPSDLRSSNNDKPLPEDILTLIESEEFTKIIDYIEAHIIFSEETNPTGCYKVCKQYAKDNGIVHTKPAKYKDELGNTQETQGFDYYEPNNPNEYVLIVMDTINLLQLERNFNKKQTIDKYSEYMIELRNRYNMSPIVIQQQNADNESVESIKINRTRPSTSGLLDSKNTGKDCNIAIGLFSPFKFGIENYLPDTNGNSYDIRKLKDTFRTMEILAARDGELGGIIGLLFDGATCSWAELPPPGNVTEMNKVYNYVKTLK